MIELYCTKRFEIRWIWSTLLRIAIGIWSMACSINLLLKPENVPMNSWNELLNPKKRWIYTSFDKNYKFLCIRMSEIAFWVRISNQNRFFKKINFNELNVNEPSFEYQQKLFSFFLKLSIDLEQKSIFCSCQPRSVANEWNISKMMLNLSNEVKLIEKSSNKHYGY